MKKGIVVWKSKYGASRKYADMLCEKTGFACVEVSEAMHMDVSDYEAVVLCGGIYASGIAGLPFLKKSAGKLRKKQVAVFCVGASPFDENALEQLRTHNLKGDLENVPLFYGRGMWDESRMTFRDRTLCCLLQKSVARKDTSALEPWMEALVEAAGQTCDWTDEKYLAPLLTFLEV